MLNYLLENWIAIIALLISLISLVTGLVTRYEAKQIQVTEKNAEVTIKYFTTARDGLLVVGRLQTLGNQINEGLKVLAQINSEKENEISPKRIEIAKHLKQLKSDVDTKSTALRETIDLFKPIEHAANVNSLSTLSLIIGKLKTLETAVEITKAEYSEWREEFERTIKELEKNIQT